MPKFCNKCGKDLVYRSENGFNIYTGEPYKQYEFLECPEGDNHTGGSI